MVGLVGGMRWVGYKKVLSGAASLVFDWSIGMIKTWTTIFNETWFSLSMYGVVPEWLSCGV